MGKPQAREKLPKNEMTFLSGLHKHTNRISHTCTQNKDCAIKLEQRWGLNAITELAVPCSHERELQAGSAPVGPTAERGHRKSPELRVTEMGKYTRWGSKRIQERIKSRHPDKLQRTGRVKTSEKTMAEKIPSQINNAELENKEALINQRTRMVVASGSSCLKAEKGMKS